MIKTKITSDQGLGFARLHEIKLGIHPLGDFHVCGITARFADGYVCTSSMNFKVAKETTLQNVEDLMDSLKHEVQKICINRRYEIENGIDTSRAYETIQAGSC
jgi:hypothetical protein